MPRLGRTIVELAAFTDEEGAARLRERFGDVRCSRSPKAGRTSGSAFHRPSVGSLWIGPPWETPPAGLALRRDRSRTERSGPARIRRPGFASSCCGTGAGKRARRRLRIRRDCDRGSHARLRAGCGDRLDEAAVEADAPERRGERLEWTSPRRRSHRVAARRRHRGGEHRSADDRAGARAAERPDARHLRVPREPNSPVSPASITSSGERWTAGRPIFPTGVASPAMATFSVRFLGCKVSHRMRTRSGRRSCATGMRSGGEADVAVDQHVLRDKRGGAKSRQAARLVRAHASPRVRDRLWREPRGDAFAGLPENVDRRLAAQRGDSGIRRRRRRRNRLRPGRREARPRARLRPRAGRLQLLVQLLRDPVVRGASRSRRRQPCWARCGGGSSRATERSCSRESTSAASGTVRLATGSRGSCERWGRRPGLSRLRLSSIEVNHVAPSSSGRSVRRRPFPGTSTCRCSRATTGC